MIPTPHRVPWTRLQHARSCVSVNLPNGGKAIMVRRVLAGGAMLVLADGNYFDPPEPVEIPADEVGTPQGVYAVAFDRAGRWTDRILKLQDRPVPALNRGETL